MELRVDCYTGEVQWWGKTPQIERQFMVEDVILWSYPISWTQMKFSTQEPWDAEYPHLCWQIQMDHLGTVGPATKATEGTCRRAEHWTCTARPPLSCGKQGHSGLTAQWRSRGLQRGLSSKHWCTIPNRAQELQSTFATQNQNTKSLTRLSFLQSNPRNRRNRCDFTDGYFPLQVLI